MLLDVIFSSIELKSLTIIAKFRKINFAKNRNKIAIKVFGCFIALAVLLTPKSLTPKSPKGDLTVA